MYKIVVFDLDGTLVNSITDLAQSVNKGLVKCGLPAHSVEEYRYFVGNGREADALRLMAVMSLGLKQGAEMTVRVEGEDEEQAAEAMKAFLEANL